MSVPQFLTKTNVLICKKCTKGALFYAVHLNHSVIRAQLLQKRRPVKTIELETLSLQNPKLHSSFLEMGDYGQFCPILRFGLVYKRSSENHNNQELVSPAAGVNGLSLHAYLVLAG